MDIYFRSLYDILGKSPFDAPLEICIVDDNARAGTIRVIVANNNKIKDKIKPKFGRTSRGVHNGRGCCHWDDGSGSGTSTKLARRRSEQGFPLFRSVSMEMTIPTTSRFDGHHGTRCNGDGTSITRRKSRWESVTNHAKPRRNNSDSALGQPTRRSSVTEEDLATVGMNMRWALEDLEEDDSEREGWNSTKGEGQSFKGRSSVSEETKIRNVSKRRDQGTTKAYDEAEDTDETKRTADSSSCSSNWQADTCPPCQPKRKSSLDSMSMIPVPAETVDVVGGALSVVSKSATNYSSAPTLSSPSVMPPGSQSKC